MKKQIPYTLALFILISSLLGPASYAGASDLAVSNGAPGMVSYQGQVSVDGHPFNGPGYFKFAIVDPPGTTSYWSNDGTSTAGSQPTHAVPLPVANGLFNVRLGDAGLTMPPLTPAVFSNPVRLLRVWFSSNNTTFTQLTPDSPITSVPYALQAQQAMDSITLGGHPASDFMSGAQYLGRHWGTLVDTTGDVGEYSSITIGADGLGLVSYYDFTNGDLKLLHCGNLLCNNGNTAYLMDATGDVGASSSITIGSDGLALIAYYDHTNGDLIVMHCNHQPCPLATATHVDTTGDVGGNTSTTVGVDGLGLISYYDFTNSNLKVVHCGNLACSTGNTITAVDHSGMVGTLTTSITIGGDGLGLISYWDFGGLNLMVLHCGNLTCSSGNSTTAVDTTGDVGGYSSITTGADGLGLVSYYDHTNGNLKVAHCGNPTCNNFNTIATIDASSGDVGLYNSITIGPDGLGLIAYQDYTNTAVKVAHCGNLLLHSNNITATVDLADDVGMNTSITIGADGLALISTYDHTGGDLKVIKLSGLGRR